MSLQWSQELCAIVNIAQKTAEKLATSTNSAIILRTMLTIPSQASNILRNLGINEQVLDSGIQKYTFNQEPDTILQRLLGRATRLASSARDDEVRPVQLLLAILDEPCIARSLLQLLGIDLEFARNVMYGTVSQTSMQTVRSSQSFLGHHSSVTTAVPVPSAIPSHTSPSTIPGFWGERIPQEIQQNPDALRQNAGFLFRPAENAEATFRAFNFQQPTSRPLPAPDNRQHKGIAPHNQVIEQALQQSGSNVQTHLELQNRSTRGNGAGFSSQRNTPSSGNHKRVQTVKESMQSSMLDLAKRFRTASQTYMEPAQSVYAKTTQEKPATSVENKTSGNADNHASNKIKPEITTNKPQDIQSKSASNVESAGKGQTETAQPQSRTQTAKNHAATPAARTNTPGNARKDPKANNATTYVRRNGCITTTKPVFNPFCLKPEKFPTLCKFGRNLLAEAKQGKLDPVIERDKEIEQLVDILNKRRSNNPLLLGEPGVGKTAIIEGLAVQMAQNEAPAGLDQHTIIALDYGAMVSGTQLRGSIQERINAIKQEVRLANGNIILFLDELHCWLGNGSGDANADAAAELKQALARGELSCIGATTPAEFKRSIDSDPAFERRFDIIDVKAPDVKTSIRIIQNGIIDQYASHHGIEYSEEAIVSAVKLSERFIHERTLPDKALSILDRAGSVARRSGEKTVTQNTIARVISQVAEIPIERLLMSDNQKLLKMEEILSQSLIGHENNIAKMARVIRRNHAGFGAHRPIGSFLFLGPTGVGKTEAAKVLADFLFGSPNNIVRFDMSEYMEQHSVAKLIGAPAGYIGFDEGGLLTEALRKRPYQIILFDEIEKAHPDVMNILLQLLDEGRLTDAKGRHVDFSNTVVILTSNLGADSLAKAMRKSIGFSEETPTMTQEDAEKLILQSAKKHFSPELWNRIEEKLVFHPLTKEQVKEIAVLLLNNSAKRLFYEKKIELVFDIPSIVPYLIQNGGYVPAYGARPMRNIIQNRVESRIAEWILLNEQTPEKLYVCARDGEVCVSTTPCAPETTDDETEDDTDNISAEDISLDPIPAENADDLPDNPVSKDDTDNDNVENTDNVENAEDTDNSPNVV